MLIYKREATALGPEDPDLPLTDEGREERRQWVEISQRVLRDVRMREGSLCRETEPSDADEVVKLEQDVGKTIVILRAHLETLETMLLPDI